VNTVEINAWKVLYIPEKWNELNRKQFLFWSKTVLRPITREKAKILIVSYFLGFRAWFRLNRIYKKERRRISNLFMTDKITREDYDRMSKELYEQIFFLGNTTRFLFEPADLTNWLLPSIRCGVFNLGKYYGPSNEMRNSSYLEFAKADAHFLKYMDNQKAANELLQFISCLYRPRKSDYSPTAADWDGDIREPFNEHNYKARSKDMSYLPAHVKQAIITNYMGVRSSIVKKHPHVFVKEDSKKKPDPHGLVKIIPHLGHIIHNDKIANSELYTVLYDMEQSEIQRIKQEEELEKLKSKNR